MLKGSDESIESGLDNIPDGFSRPDKIKNFHSHFMHQDQNKKSQANLTIVMGNVNSKAATFVSFGF